MVIITIFTIPTADGASLITMIGGHLVMAIRIHHGIIVHTIRTVGGIVRITIIATGTDTITDTTVVFMALTITRHTTTSIIIITLMAEEPHLLLMADVWGAHRQPVQAQDAG